MAFLILFSVTVMLLQTMTMAIISPPIVPPPMLKATPTGKPMKRPTRKPTRRPTRKPTVHPIRKPSRTPSRIRTARPSRISTKRPSRKPSRTSTKRPSRTPTKRYSTKLSRIPTKRSSRKPSRIPTKRLPSAIPTMEKSVFTGWKHYTTPLFIPPILDMRSGGSLSMYMGIKNNHSFGAGLMNNSTVYGYGTSLSTVSYPGPTILTSKGIPINITWHNEIASPHILHDHIEPSLIMNASMCYPNCGVPAIVHVHGLETPAEFDGLPTYSFGKGKFREDYYTNSQPGATLIYHDHALGLTRLNVWAGLAGLYIIEDTQGIDSSIRVDCDIPLLIQDKLLGVDGSVLYPTPDAECLAPGVSTSLWKPEAFGSVNLVNGVVSPFVTIPQEQCRLRLIVGTNARDYSLHIPFADVCQIIAKDSAYIKNPIQLTKPSSAKDTTLSMFPYERVDLFCDFRNTMIGSYFNISDTGIEEDSIEGAKEIIQVRVVASRASAQRSIQIPNPLNPIKDLRALWQASGGKVRNITLEEILNDAEPDCPKSLSIWSGPSPMVFTANFPKDNYIPCDIGMVERWNFHNPTADTHPFHWHLVHAQCGPSEYETNANELRDVYPIPASSSEDRTTRYNEVTQVCYVACTPGNYLIESSTTAPTDFGFPITMPYLLHCHILEHEENMMMTWFLPVKASS